ncbi:hypothetical protein JCM11491_001489 [Sporobolomyces phaffii]
MPPRKASTRVTKKGKAVMDEDSASEDEAGHDDYELSDDDDDEERVSKKKKNKHKKQTSKSTVKKTASASGRGNKVQGRNKKNKLEVFNTMPLDVLIEIMKQTDPKTLLAMSRTCAVFRRILHSDGGASAWKSARRNVHLGALQRPDVTEWEFAQLLFDKTCGVCGKKGAATVDYVLFVRGCADCMRANSKRREKLNESLYHDDAFDLVPYSLWSSLKFYWKPMLLRVSNQLDAVEDKPKRRAKFVESRQQIQSQAQADAQMIESWIARSKVLEEGAKQDKRATRILENLRLEGYDEQDLASPTLRDHPDVNNGRELSDNVWKRIKPILASLLDDERTRRLTNEAAVRQRQRAFALKPFYHQIETSLPPSSTSDLRTYYPPFANFLSLPSVQALYIPEGAAPSTHDLAMAKGAIVSEVEEFAVDLRKVFVANLFAAYTALDPDLNPDDLSTTSCVSAVKCPSTLCTTYATFPAILEHARVCCGDRVVLTDDSLVTTPLDIETIRQILAAVESSSDPTATAPRVTAASSVAELYALGDSFACETCELKAAGNTSALGVATWASAYKTDELNWVALLHHVKLKHPEGNVTIRYTRSPPPLSPTVGDEGGFVADESLCRSEASGEGVA